MNKKQKEIFFSEEEFKQFFCFLINYSIKIALFLLITGFIFSVTFSEVTASPCKGDFELCWDDCDEERKECGEDCLDDYWNNTLPCEENVWNCEDSCFQEINNCWDNCGSWEDDQDCWLNCEDQYMDCSDDCWNTYNVCKEPYWEIYEVCEDECDDEEEDCRWDCRDGLSDCASNYLTCPEGMSGNRGMCINLDIEQDSFGCPSGYVEDSDQPSLFYRGKQGICINLDIEQEETEKCCVNEWEVEMGIEPQCERVWACCGFDDPDRTEGCPDGLSL